MSKRNQRHCTGSRRRWFVLFSSWLLLSLCASPFGALLDVAAQDSGAGLPTFEEIAPAASGILWVHDNAMSEQRYLPETLGPGCAFLDYDNDGWMDIYLVNYGPSDFFKP